MQELDWQIRAKRPIIYICSHEEMRVVDAIKTVCQRPNQNWAIVSWDCAQGLCVINPGVSMPSDNKILDPSAMLDWFAEAQVDPEAKHAVLILKDFHKFIGADGSSGVVEAQIIRQLRNMAYGFMGRPPKTIIILAPTLYLPAEIEKLCSVIDWPLPETEHIEDKILSMLEYAKVNTKLAEFTLTYPPEELEVIVSAFQGLTMDEIQLLCSYMMLTSKALVSNKIAQHKRDVIRKSGVLDWIEPNDTLATVGGLHELKLWLAKRARSFTEEAKKFGLPANPKGLLILGIQGGGKSLTARAIAAEWGLPLLRLDVGRIFHSNLGSTEANLRHVFKIAESISPCILWIDEIEKGFSGSGSSNMTDGGTSARVFGAMLTWMQEKTAPVYVVATANDVSNLPPELLRKGRFDEIFFVDLPSSEDREEIFNIHLVKSKRDPSRFDIPLLAEVSDGYTGAEIEASIISAMYDAFDDDQREITSDDVINAIKETVPISVTMKERIDILRAWAKQRARNASCAPESANVKRKTIAVKQPNLPKVHEDKQIDPDEQL
jgi:SpoVK/Ycf46/Vps4 family AAA+-type ATPase